MVEFLLGVLIASAIGLYIVRLREAEFRSTLKSIHAGEASADENGYVGWNIP